MCNYPPLHGCRLEKLKTEIRLIPETLKQDAIQEAWLAHLGDKCPIKAVKRYAEQERRHNQRFITNQELVGLPG